MACKRFVGSIPIASTTPEQHFCDRSDYEDEVGGPNGAPNSDES